MSASESREPDSAILGPGIRSTEVGLIPGYGGRLAYPTGFGRLPTVTGSSKGLLSRSTFSIA
jgi:hypothetical protein